MLSLRQVSRLGAASALALILAGCGQDGNRSTNAEAAHEADGNLSAATEYDIVRAMLDLAGVTPDDLVVDLGSGDGRIPIMAARDKGARGMGVELDPQRVRQSNVSAQQARVGNRVEFRQQDLFATPLNDVTVLTLYLLPEINLQLRPRILSQMRPGTRVVSNSFDMGDWPADQQRNIGGTRIFLWIVPARIEGRWQLQANDGVQGALTFQQRYQQFSGTSDIGTIGNGRLNGARIGFDIGNRHFEGRVDGNSITGDGWRATKSGG